MSLLPKMDTRQVTRALVLGGKGDIGSAIAAALTADGMEVTAVGRNDFDLSIPVQIDAFFARHGNAFDVLVHSGGLNVPKPFDLLSEEDIHASLEVNLHGFLHVARLCLPYWKQGNGARVLVISSLYGVFGRRARLPYVMAKHALNGAVKTLAIELAEHGVLVNALSPGYIETKMTSANNSPATIARFTAGIPLRRLGAPEDVAEVASFLCSSKNRYVTGQDVVVDGGFSVGAFQD
jgi:3-oxoacyl-[acyl-carrier protein] reductase